MPRLLLLLLLTVADGAGAVKPVLVHYMPWFVARPHSASWGWHWTMNHFDPEIPGPGGRREIASHYYPLIGPYDSADPVVLEYHVALMKLAGIDGVIVDWYGVDDYADYALINERTAALFHFTRRAGLKFSVCYEDRTIRNEIEGGFINATSAIPHARDALRHLATNYFSDPAYLRWNGSPVLLNFGPQYFTRSSDWQSIFSVLEPSSRPAFFTLDNRLSAGVGAFNWPPMWLSQGSGGVLSPSQLNNYLDAFEQKTSQAPVWPAFISGAFPGFHDIYETAGTGASHGFLDDRAGATFRETLERAMTNASAFVQIVTWNDFGEGTAIEPTVERGFRELEILQHLRREHLDPAFDARTNDLALAVRLHNLRRNANDGPAQSAELDRAFEHLTAGSPATAQLLIEGLESGRPVLYGVSRTGNGMSFRIGGGLSAAGVVVQRSYMLGDGAWQGIATLTPGAEPLVFDFEPENGAPAAYFRAANLAP